ncbi:MAG TPA: hypothetical protein VG125_02255 [Pirellulales bacterium]|nr:hypothetical protein [Pirellulales bacterium]
MNDSLRNADKQLLLDLLVDGELSEGERRELLTWCEREHDGWRRCALAFLEAQSWSNVLGELTETSHPAAASQHAVSAAQAVNATSVARPNPFWGVRQWGTMLAMAASVVLAFTLGLWIRDADKAGQIAPPGPPVTNVVKAGEGRGRVADRREGGWLPVEPTAVPDEVRQALERLGHHVEQQRRLVPYRLDDGRRMVIPVDQVEVRPVENRSYQ